VFCTTSISGSNCPCTPRQAQRYLSAPHVAPPSVEILSTWYGNGHRFPQAVGPVYRVANRYTYGAFGSAAIAGSQSSAVGLITCSPAQPVGGAAGAAFTRSVPVAFARRQASSRPCVS